MATWIDLVRRFHPEASDEVAEYLLWGATCFPFCGVLRVARQLKRAKKAEEEKKSICFRCGALYERQGIISFDYDCPDCKNKELLTSHNEAQDNGT